MSLQNKAIVLFFMFFLIAETLDASDNECSQNCFKLEMDSIIKNHTDIYRDNPELFWKVLNEARVKAYMADSFNEINQFMGFLRIDNPPAEVEEFFSEGLENLCAEKPIFFKEAMRLLDSNLRTELNKKLNQPLFREEKELKACRYRDFNDH